MTHPHSILNDPEVKATGLTTDHIDAMQSLTDAIGNHTPEYDNLIVQFKRQPLKHGDLQGRVLQALSLFSTNPQFEQAFTALMTKLHPISSNHPLAKHLNK